MLDKLKFLKNFVSIFNNYNLFRSFLSYLITFFFILFIFDINIISLNNLLVFDINNLKNFFFLFITNGFFFGLYILTKIKFLFMSFIFWTPFFLFFGFNNETVLSFFLDLNYITKNIGFNDINIFNDFLINLFEIEKFIIHNNYFYSNKFIKIIFLNSNLPIFFYFGLLFLITTLSSLIFLSYFGLYGSFFINFISILLFWFSSIYYFDSFYLDNCFYKFSLGKWFVISSSNIINFDFLIDSISYSFMFLTLTIAVFVYIYAFSYFRYEPNVERLILLINCFVLSMIILVTCGNFFVLFLGWELIGLTSFFLINFWSTRISTLKAAFKAFVFNKFSDVSLLFAIFIIYFCCNDLNIISFNNQISTYNNFYIVFLGYNISVIEIISFFLVFCSFVKSAQFGFHIWLPDSMEAPVPASALIHSATLVSAGVFIFLRLSPLFEFSLYSYYIIPIIGSFTAFFGGLCSIYQSDIKKILAYSTISHCGFLMVCFSIYIPEYTILYLYIHGFFKAAVFLCVGNVIRFSRNYQDFRKMGGFWKYLPFECFSSFVCLINLCGLPFTLGYYIKHLILIGVYLNNYFLYFVIINILGGAVAGLIYSYRLFYYVFFDFKKAKKIIYNQSNRTILKSKFFTNVTLASNLSIIFLIISSYIISLYMFNIFLNKTSIGDGLNIYSVNVSQYSEFNNPIISSISNIGYFNWILVLIIFSILIISWRFVNNYYIVLNKFNLLLTWLIFFYIFYIFLT